MSLWAAFGAKASAAVWIHPPGAGYAELRVAHATSTAVFLEDGQTVPQADLLGDTGRLFTGARSGATDVSAYLELGVLRGIELTGSLPFRAASARWPLAEGSWPDIVQRNEGFGDATAGVRAGGLVDRVALSVTALGRAPLYDNSPDVLNVAAGNADFEDDRPALGPGTMELDVLGGAGVGFERGWVLGEAGVRLRDRRYSAVLPARAQVGLRADPVEVWLGADLVAPITDGAAPDFFRDRWGSGPIVVDRQTAFTASLGGALHLGGSVSLTAGVGRTLAGRRYPRLTSASVGLASSFGPSS